MTLYAGAELFAVCSFNYKVVIKPLELGDRDRITWNSLVKEASDSNGC